MGNPNDQVIRGWGHLCERSLRRCDTRAVTCRDAIIGSGATQQHGFVLAVQA